MTYPSATRRRPPGRYDPPSRLAGRLLAVALTVLLLALLAAIGEAVLSRSAGDDVRARVIGFEVRSDSVVRIDLEVTKPAGSRAYCLLRSRGRDGAEVGREVVAVDPVGSAEQEVRLEHDLSTTARGVTGEVTRCSPSPDGAP